jgi:hypothetical protein
MVDQLGLTGWLRSKEKVVDPHAKPLKLQASLFFLLEFGIQLIHNFDLEGFIRRAPKCELHGRRQCHMKCVKLSGHLGMAEHCDPQPLQQVIPHPYRTNNGEAQLRALGL